MRACAGTEVGEGDKNKNKNKKKEGVKGVETWTLGGGVEQLAAAADCREEGRESRNRK